MKKRLSLLLTIVLCLICSMNVFAAGTVKDGKYSIAGTLAGGTHGITMKSPTTLTVSGGKMTAVIVMSSKNYTVMKMNGQEYDNETPGSNSTFTIPIAALDTPIAVSATTVAMSQPHDIDYTITLDSKSLPADALVNEAPAQSQPQSQPQSEAPSSSVEASSTASSSTAQSTVEASSEAMSLTATPDPGKSEDAPDMGLFIAIIVAVIVVGGAAIFIITKIRKNKET